MSEVDLIGVAEQGNASSVTHRWLKHDAPVVGYASACGFQFAATITECTEDAAATGGRARCTSCFTASMTPEEAADLLRAHNAWRRGSDGPATDPRRLGLAIDLAVEYLSR